VTEHAEDEAGPELPARFRNWLGFLVAAVAVNLLFVWGMIGNSGDPKLALWYKALIWLPFNVIATLLYYVIRLKLADRRAGALYGALCLTMIAANWAVMFFI
jgi:hypothetical protein